EYYCCLFYSGVHVF
nr:immunoglobulin light chain junction region [Macaca mulatta]